MELARNVLHKDSYFLIKFVIDLNRQWRKFFMVAIDFLFFFSEIALSKKEKEETLKLLSE